MTTHVSQIARPRPMPFAMVSLGAISGFSGPGYSGFLGC